MTKLNAFRYRGSQHDTRNETVDHALVVPKPDGRELDRGLLNWGPADGGGRHHDHGGPGGNYYDQVQA